jgi:hypothetical protein
MEEAKGGLEERVARIEGILGQMNERLNPLESRFTQFEARMESRFNQLFYAVITSWVTIIAAVLVAIFKG